MADTHTATPEPIFYETLAVAAKCTPLEAKEHYEVEVNLGRPHPVERFLEDYAS